MNARLSSEPTLPVLTDSDVGHSLWETAQCTSGAACASSESRPLGASEPVVRFLPCGQEPRGQHTLARGETLPLKKTASGIGPELLRFTLTAHCGRWKPAKPIPHQPQRDGTPQRWTQTVFRPAREK